MRLALAFTCVMSQGFIKDKTRFILQKAITEAIFVILFSLKQRRLYKLPPSAADVFEMCASLIYKGEN